MIEPRRVAQLPVTAEHPGTSAKRQWRRERRRRRRPDLEIEVIAWDGEGFDEDGRHRYALLTCALGTEEGEIIPGPELRDRAGLSSFQLLDLIWRVGSSRPHALHVMYGASYDWDHWIRDVDLETARAIKSGHPVKLGPWTVRCNGLWFEMAQGHGNSFKRVTVWDLWKFWGTGFEPALRATFPDFEGLGVIKEFKNLRGQFHWEMMDEVAHYNRLELVGLVRLTRQFFDDLEIADVPAPSFLTGAGALAGALDRKFGIPKHVGDQHFGNPAVEDAILRAFSAGRIEPWRVGHTGHSLLGPTGPYPDRDTIVWQHDLISAYPSAMIELPSMAEGSWEWVEGPDVPNDWDHRMSVWFVRWDFTGSHGAPVTRRYYPFFYRTRQGNVLYPPAGVGWQWWPEVVTARSLGWHFNVVGGYVWRPAERLRQIHPYAWVPLIFQRRADLKAAGKEGPQRVLKYGLNALYGKMCQSRGATYSKPPANQNYAWAGWVTSHCRSQIMWAAHQAPDAVLYQMTDSVVSLQPLDVPVGKGLGYWEIEERVSALVAQAGVGSTWCTGCKDHPVGGEHPKYRGFDEGSVNARAIWEMWEYNYRAGWAHPLTCQVRRPVTLAEAVLSEERWAEFGNWEDQDRDLNIYGGEGKRFCPKWEDRRFWEQTYPLEPAAAYTKTDDQPLSLRQLENYCLANEIDPMSAPYQPGWSADDPWSLPEVMGRFRTKERQALEG